MIALIGDVHGNLEELQSVFDDIDGLYVDEVLCPGDIAGYGPDPESCVDFIMILMEGRSDEKGRYDIDSGVVKSVKMYGMNDWCAMRLLFGRRDFHYLPR